MLGTGAGTTAVVLTMAGPRLTVGPPLALAFSVVDAEDRLLVAVGPRRITDPFPWATPTSAVGPRLIAGPFPVATPLLAVGPRLITGPFPCATPPSAVGPR